MGILSVIGKGLAKKSGKDSSKDVAKRSGEVIGRRPDRDMGMVEEVTPKRLSGPEVREAAREAEKKGGRNAALAVSAAAHAAAIGAVAMSDRNKEDKKEPTKTVSAGRVSEGKVTKEANEPVKETSKAKEADNFTKDSAKPSTFGSAFKEARSAGKDTFTYKGKKYTTEMAGEKKAASNSADKATGVREGRNENIDNDTRKRAMDSVSNLNKGGMVGKYAKGGMIKANCGASVPPAQKAKK